jgi:hypothetical protein
LHIVAIAKQSKWHDSVCRWDQYLPSYAGGWVPRKCYQILYTIILASSKEGNFGWLRCHSSDVATLGIASQLHMGPQSMIGWYAGYAIGNDSIYCATYTTHRFAW